jgi:pimeloyl-ACP methyl ester carboxylesterase
VGAVVGSGARGVVLAHETNANLCAWFPFARRLADAGYLVLALDLRGYGASGFAPAAATTWTSWPGRRRSRSGVPTGSPSSALRWAPRPR